MTQPNRFQRRTSIAEKAALSESLSKKLVQYAVAAAGCGTLTLTAPATAGIIYTPANIVVMGPTGSLTFDVNHDGIADFGLRVGFSAANGVDYLDFSTIGHRGNGVEGSASAFGRRVFVLNPGDPIGPSHGFIGSGPINIGLPLSVSNGYVGLLLALNRQRYYGWAGFNSRVALGEYTSVTLTGFAYETIANKSINAGQASETPEPATLNLLALGALALGFWRRKQHRVGH
jgi:hypothetical protein